tara:strand:+ start:298 stop:465 length:168 start_codon:yes stop_codon:yes gene_type:complete
MLILKLALYEAMILLAFGCIQIRERKRRDRMNALLAEWIKRNTQQKRNKNIRVIG